MSDKQRHPIGWARRATLSGALVLGLLAPVTPQKLAAQFPGGSRDLPGTWSGKKIAITVAAVAGGAILGLHLLSRGKNSSRIELDIQEARISDTRLGESGSGAVKITNATADPITITTVAMTGRDFALPQTDTPVAVAPGAAIAIPVNFTPSRTGNAKGELSISASDGRGKGARLRVPVRARGF